MRILAFAALFPSHEAYGAAAPGVWARLASSAISSYDEKRKERFDVKAKETKS
jgi:hypothetical protein